MHTCICFSLKMNKYLFKNIDITEHKAKLTNSRLLSSGEYATKKLCQASGNIWIISSKHTKSVDKFYGMF